MQNSSSGSSSAVPRTRSDLQDLSAYSRGGSGDYSKPSLNYSRPSIDYPQIGSRQAPPVNEALRPHRPAPAPPPPQSQSLVPSVPLTRPPLAKPAPMRSNSSFSSMHLPSYSSSHSQFPTTNMSFDDSMIGLSGLKNLGNTCYMNSTIQCLSAAIPFARYFKSEYSQPVLSYENRSADLFSPSSLQMELIARMSTSSILWEQRVLWPMLSENSFELCGLSSTPTFRRSLSEKRFVESHLVSEALINTMHKSS